MIIRKLGEDDLKYPTLYLLYTKGNMTTAKLKEEIIDMLNPQGDNLKPLENRADSAITQIIRNIVSHRREYHNNIIYQKLAYYDETTQVLSITDKGIKELNNHLINLIKRDIE